MQELGFGLTVIQVRTLAYRMANVAGRGHFFSKTKQIASKWWWAQFQSRYCLTLRVAENLSTYRASCSNPVLISDFYDKLEQLVGVLKIDPKRLKSHVWNVDETGLQYVVKPAKVVTELGKKYIYRRSYSEKGETQTLIGCICADGSWLPPTIIFKGIRWNDQLKKNCLPNTQVKLSERGWINSELFKQWFQFFIESVGGETRPLILLMDSHGAHISPEIIQLAIENKIFLLTFPSHTTHLLQPLDVAVYKSLKCEWAKCLNEYMRQHPHDKPNRYNFFEIFNPAFLQSMSHSNIFSAFRKTGIIPFNRESIPAEAIAPSQLTERNPVPVSTVLEEGQSNVSENVTLNHLSPNKKKAINNLLTLPSVPKTPSTKRKRTFNPAAKCLTPPDKMKHHNTSDEVGCSKSLNVSANQDQPSSSSSGVHKGRPTKKKTKKHVESDWTCSTCKGLYSEDVKIKNGAEWIQCSFCQETYHERCQNEIPIDVQDIYMCDICCVKEGSSE